MPPVRYGTAELRGQHGEPGGHGELDAGLRRQPRRRQLGFLRLPERPESLRLHGRPGHPILAPDVRFQYRPRQQRLLGPGPEPLQRQRRRTRTPRTSTTNPTFRRMYWRALQELVNGPLNVANSGPLHGRQIQHLRGQRAERRESHFGHQALAHFRPFEHRFATGRRKRLELLRQSRRQPEWQPRLRDGHAPVNINTVLVNGTAYPITWTSVTGFRLTVPLNTGTNALSFVGVDRHGQPVAGASNFVAVTYTGTLPSPAGQVVFNEIMCNPAVSGRRVHRAVQRLLHHGLRSVRLANPRACLHLPVRLAHRPRRLSWCWLRIVPLTRLLMAPPFPCSTPSPAHWIRMAACSRSYLRPTCPAAR